MLFSFYYPFLSTIAPTSLACAKIVFTAPKGAGWSSPAWFAPPFVRRWNVPRTFSVAPPHEFGVKLPAWTQRRGPLVLVLPRPPGCAAGRRGNFRFDRVRNRVPPAGEFCWTIFRQRAGQVSRRRAGPWKGRWRSPVSMSAPRVFPRECGEIPPAQILRPGSRPVCPRVYRHGPG